MNKELRKKQEKRIIRKCHKCDQIVEAVVEQESCLCCGKSFMPLNYFEKVHNHKGKYQELFATSNDLDEDDLVRGIFVLW